MPDHDEVDVVVIGLGPGGEAAGTRLAQAGLKVIGVDARLVGGECPYFGCVPTKMMVRAADTLAETRRVSTLAGSADARPSWAPVAARIRSEATDNWDDTVAVRRFESAGGRFIRGRARITAPGQVGVTTDHGEQVVHATRAILLNPGTEPAIPPIDGLADAPFWTNRDAVAVEDVPASLTILGAGPIGCEFAQVFARFGSAVTIVEPQPRLLPAEEPEVGDVLAKVFAAEDIQARTGASATKVSPDATVVSLDDGSAITSERLLVATGRRADLAALGIGAVGLDETAHGIDVDARMRAAERVWAIGDVTGKGAFTHVSMYQAGIAAADVLGENPHPAEYRAVPRVTFTDPEVGAVGLTEQAARDRGIAVRTGVAAIPSSARGWIHKAGNDGVVKLVEDTSRGVLVGATVVSPAGGEVLAMLTLAVDAQVPTARLRRMIYAYPTFHRAIEDALADLS
ncbi:NAD(P)/FAD-dependent oxidoreductase [Mycobacterium sp.]|uniref:dihydrolipoyl dehydrogenase family protein n=1 Tax=Mycobacterium sp. TaxID=1785 RepID=UPI0012828864|nr:NAD(P)/FAD-dependent oxidoreductase [Mycobacterium sp.]KAA8962464.1 MAG: NAD(P)/FAD-dependent oxidoreductase [Mycobacterium sp.]